MILFGLAACGFGATEPSIGMVGAGVAECAAEASGLDDGWEDALEADGCGFRVDAINPDATIHLVFDAPAFVDAAQGDPVDVTYTLPDDTLNFTVETGCGFPTDVCDGADSSTVTQVWTPVSGAVHLTTAPDGAGAAATLAFTGVELEGDTTSATLDAAWSVDLYMGE